MKGSIILLLILVSSCINAPDFDRNSEYDMSSGIPYIRDAQYQVGRMGLVVNWIDGSIENDKIIITQKKYDQSASGLDSSIIVTEFPEDASFFQDLSGEYGYPYSIIITSVIYGVGENIKAQFSDTLNLEFGELIYRSQFQNDGSTYINWQNLPNPFANEAVLVELDNGNGWQEIDSLPYASQSFGYPSNNLNTGAKFRISLTVPNFKNGFSRASSFVVEID